jgi:hypothetical protein
MESCPAQTTPNLPIRRHPVKEHPRHNFFLVGILRVSSVQAQNSTVSSFRIFTTAHGLPKLTQPVFSVNARGFFLSCYRLYHPAIASKPFAPQQSQLQQADQQLLPIETVAIRLFSSSESTKITNPPLSPTSTRNPPLPSRVRSNNPSDNCYQLKPRRLDCFSVQHPPKHRHCPRTRVHQTSESIESTN